jgi:hypothetical protein
MSFLDQNVRLFQLVTSKLVGLFFSMNSFFDKNERFCRPYLRGGESTVHPVDSGWTPIPQVDGGLRGGLVDWWTAVDSVDCR